MTIFMGVIMSMSMRHCKNRKNMSVNVVSARILQIRLIVHTDCLLHLLKHDELTRAVRLKKIGLSGA